MTEPNDKIVLVVEYAVVTGDQDADVIEVVDALRDRIEDEDVWIEVDDGDETSYSFTVTHAEVVDRDVVETAIVETDAL